MPNVRCWGYTAEGAPIGRGCDRIGRCEFVHPSDAGWNGASLPRNNRGSFNARKRKEPDSARDESTSTFSGPAGNAASKSTWGDPPPTGPRASRGAPPSGRRASLNSESFGESSTSTNQSSWNSAQWNWTGNTSTSTSPGKEAADVGNVDGNAALWAAPASPPSSSTWGDATWTSGGGWGDTMSESTSTSAPTWGAQTAAASTWANSWAAASPAVQPASSPWPDNIASMSKGKQREESSTFDITVEPQATEIAGPSALPSVDDIDMQVDDPPGHVFKAPPSPPRDTEPTEYPTRVSPLRTNFGNATPSQQPSAASSPLRSPDTTVASKKVEQSHTGSVKSSRQHSYSPGRSPSPNKIYDHVDLIRALAKAVSYQLDYDQARAAQIRNNHLQHSKTSASSGPLAQEKLKELNVEQKIKMNDAEKRRDRAVERVKYIADRCGSLGSAARLEKIGDPITYLQTALQKVEDWCQAADIDLARMNEGPGPEVPSASATPQNPVLASDSASTTHDRPTSPTQILEYRVIKAEVKMADLEIYSDELHQTGQRILDECIAQKWKPPIWVVTEREVREEHLRDCKNYEEKVRGMKSGLSKVQREIRDLKERDAQQKEELAATRQEQVRLTLQLEQLGKADEASQQTAETVLSDLEVLKAKVNGIVDAEQPIPVVDVMSIRPQLQEALVAASRHDLEVAMESVTKGVKEALAVYQRTMAKAIWEHIKPVTHLNNVFQDMLDEQLEAARSKNEGALGLKVEGAPVGPGPHCGVQ